MGICEDNPGDLARLRSILSACRPHDPIIYFRDATNLLGAILEGLTFDLLFLDIYLPDMRGTELAGAVRQAHPAP